MSSSSEASEVHVRMVDRSDLPAGQDWLPTHDVTPTEPASPNCVQWMAAVDHDGVLCGVTKATVSAGRTGTVRGPWLTPEADESVAIRLIEESTRWLSDGRTVLIQSFISPECVHLPTTFQSANFAHVTDIEMLMSARGTFPVQKPHVDFQLQTVGYQDFPTLETVIDRTYVNSCDCPAVTGCRTARDSMADMLQRGGDDPKPWFFVQDSRGRQRGCLLIADLKTRCELMYMGLEPTARRRGWGHQLVRAAQWIARTRNCETLTLAVDTANEAAIACYARAGFMTYERFSLWIKRNVQQNT